MSLKPLIITLMFWVATPVKQQSTVTFPSLGPVTIRAIEQPKRLPTVTFSDQKGSVLLSQQIGKDNSLFFKINPLENTEGRENPTVRFKEVQGPILNQPAILAVAQYHGGSDCAYEGTLIGEYNGRMKSYFPKQVTNNAEGGMYVGNLGGNRGYGFASWNFIWDMDTESHPGLHRYHVKLYRFDSQSGTMFIFFDRNTSKKYEDPDQALAEFGLQYKDILSTFTDFTC